MNGAPLVSVVMAAYNAQRTIGETIRSLLAQTHERIEILVGDDASTDNTTAIVAAFADPRVKLHRNATNLGPGPTRDRLIEAASGDFLAFVDADDVMNRDRLRDLLQALPGNGDCLIFDDVLQCHDTPDGLVDWRTVHGPRAFGSTRDPTGRLIGPLSLARLLAARRLLIKPLVKTQLVRQLGVTHPAMRYGEDGVFFWRLVGRGVPAWYLPSANYRYRITPGSASASSRRHTDLIACLELILQEDLDENDASAVRRRIKRLRINDRIRAEAAGGGIGKLRAAWRLLTHPSNFMALMRELPVSVGYRLSRRKHDGRAR